MTLKAGVCPLPCFFVVESPNLNTLTGGINCTSCCMSIKLSPSSLSTSWILIDETTSWIKPHIMGPKNRYVKHSGIRGCFRVRACRTNTLLGSLRILGQSGAWPAAVMQKVLASPMMQVKAWQFSEAVVLYQKR